MQKTKFRNFVDLLLKTIDPILTDTWSKRSILLLSLLSGFYFTNSLLSFLLDKSYNTIYIAIIILLIMELLIRASLISNFSKVSIILISINNIRIG